MWGWNESGQLGLPSRGLRKPPQQQGNPHAGAFVFIPEKIYYSTIKPIKMSAILHSAVVFGMLYMVIITVPHLDMKISNIHLYSD